MNILTIDFRDITTRADFYRIFADKCQIPYQFGDNLDALWDTLTTELPLPLHLRLKNLKDPLTSEQFRPVIDILREAEQVLNGLLTVSVEDSGSYSGH